MSERVGFVSTRFAGSDGVSLESAKWAEALWESTHVSYWYGGRLDRAPHVHFCVPEAHFGHPESVWINERIWGKSHRSRIVSRRIRELAEYIKGTLYNFVERFDITVLIVENALTIPMNLPLGVAITEYLAETGMPTIAHHHDFYWERTRFSVNAVQDYLDFAFPPRVPNLLHVTINQAAQEDLGFRKGLSSELVPNVLDFETPPPQIDNYSADIRNEIGLTADDIMVLQPTRVVPRKGIEHAIKLIEMLGDPRCKLVITHESGDEGMEYHHMIAELAREANVDLQFVDSRIGEIRSRDSEGRKIYTLWDFYLHADLVTFPSLYEGFGNAFLETLYFKKPILMNRYAIFARDIEPKGFQLPLIDGFVTKRVVDEVRRILENDAYRQAMVDHNFVLATKFYSYRVLKSKLETLISDLKGL